MKYDLHSLHELSAMTLAKASIKADQQSKILENEFLSNKRKQQAIKFRKAALKKNPSIFKLLKI